MPTCKDVRVESYTEILNKNVLNIPEWLDPLVKASYFMHAFNQETLLPKEIMKEVFDDTKIEKN